MYDSTSALLKEKGNFGAICDVLNITKFTEKEIEYLEEYKMCLAVALDRLQGETSCFFGELLPTVKTVEEKLLKLQVQQLKYCSPLVKALLAGVQKRFSALLALESKEAILAAVCHPYHKLRWVSEGRKEEIINFFVKAILAESKSTDPESPKLIHLENEMRQEDDVFFAYDEAESVQDLGKEQFANKIRLECHQYFGDSDLSLRMLNKYATIKKAFMKYNTTLPSSAPVERLFNYAGLILTPNRRLLSDFNFEKLLFLKANHSLIT